MTESFAIGVDVGGTNTDAVLLRHTAATHTFDVLAACKTTTQRALGASVLAAVDHCRAALPAQAACSVHIGTTAFVNALLERSPALARVAVVRIGADACAAVAPFAALPGDLRTHVEGPVLGVAGGHSIFGSALAPLDEAALVAGAQTLLSRGDERVHVAVVAPFSTTSPGHELRAAEILRRELGERVDITLSHQVGEPHLLKREHIAVLNASLRPLAARVCSEFKTALGDDAFLTANDGTLLSLDDAAAFPARCLTSGPTNSIRGAALLAGNVTNESLFVLDIGGTTTELGVVTAGQPRMTAIDQSVGGVVINARVPDVRSVALGGGSMLVAGKLSNTSVGFKLTSEALVFGGSQPTLTDAAVVVGHLTDCGDKALASDKLAMAAADQVFADVRGRLGALIDEHKTAPGDVRVLLVGGGAALLGDMALSGASSVERPPLSSVANAVGAALAQVSADVDVTVRIDADQADSRAAAIEAAKEQARAAAIERGGAPASVRIVECGDNALAYLEEPHIRIRVKALATRDAFFVDGKEAAFAVADNVSVVHLPLQGDASAASGGVALERGTLPDVGNVDDRADTPQVDDNGHWRISAADIEKIAIGAGVLGVGGGGNVFMSRIRALLALKEKPGSMRVASVAHWRDGKLGDGLIVPCAFFGAPAALIEQLGSGEELRAACDAVLGGRKLAGLVSAEIGGVNGVEPLLLASKLGVPLLDADGMGRAFPRILHYLPFTNEQEPTKPAAMASWSGKTIPFDANSALEMEEAMRSAVMELGAAAAIALPPLRKETAFVTGSLSRAWRIGDLIQAARRDKQSPVDALAAASGGRVLIRGNICDVKQGGGEGGFTAGHVDVRGVGGEDEGRKVRVCFQNENLIVQTLNEQGEPTDVLATVPDLIAVLDRENGRAFFVDELAFGLRIAVVVLPCDPQYRREPALTQVSPKAFGHDLDPVLLDLPEEQTLLDKLIV